MLTAVHPKLPMRDKAAAKAFYIEKLGFRELGNPDFEPYLMVQKDNIELHFFEFKTLDPAQNYGQVYIRTDAIEQQYREAVDQRLNIPALGHLQTKPWGQREFSLLDPDNNLLTFGQGV